jgi:hypothetical protein
MTRQPSFRFRTEADRYWHDKVGHPQRHGGLAVLAVVVIVLVAML